MNIFPDPTIPPAHPGLCPQWCALPAGHSPDHTSTDVRTGMTTRNGVDQIHPAWCSGGPQCDGARTAGNGALEWAHGVFAYVGEGLDHTHDLFLSRIDEVTPDGEHRAYQGLCLTGSGSFTADQARRLAAAILAAADQLDAGLEGTPAAEPVSPVSPRSTR